MSRGGRCRRPGSWQSSSSASPRAGKTPCTSREVLFWLGEFASARAHLEQGRVIADSVQASSAALRDRPHTDVRCRRYGAWTLWYLGYPDQALQLSHEALVLAQERGSPWIVAWPCSMWASSGASAARHRLPKSRQKPPSRWLA